MLSNVSPLFSGGTKILFEGSYQNVTQLAKIQVTDQRLQPSKGVSHQVIVLY